MSGSILINKAEDLSDETVEKKSKSTFEVTHVNIRTSIILVILKIMLIDMLAVFAYLGFFWIISSGNLTNSASSLLISNSYFYFIKLIATLYIIIQWLNEYYEITPSQIIYRRGILWRRVDVYNYNHIRSIGIQQSFIGKILDYGSLSIFDRGVYKYYFLNFIHNPHRYFKILHSLCPDADIEKDVFREKIHDEDIKP
jgi:membrane protein YdbS with pleckstrin-like domain